MAARAGSEQGYDVVVVGAGNAGLCAALAARETGARVLVLEKAPRALRGGNTYFTGGLFRFAFDGLDDVASVVADLSAHERARADVGSYPRHAFFEDVMRLTEGLADPALVEILTGESLPTMRWLAGKGVRWLLATGRQAFKVGEKFRFYGNLVVEAVGGGVGLSDMELAAGERAGVAISYEAKATRLLLDRSGRIMGVEIREPDGFREVAAGAVVLACGGFEANAEMRARYLGPDWELARVRGTPFNTGDGHRMALDIGA
jgi:tricarballylate dehydrogenase